jgi:hypothetical protein
MKNIHILPTDKPSRLAYDFNKLILNSKLLSPTLYKNQNIYITNSEKPKQGEWSLYQNKIHKCIEDILGDEFKKIILTTDQDLIKDGVQAIDDEFLEWFVKNPSCEWVEIQYRYNFYAGQDLIHYTIIIPTDKPDRLAIPLDCTHDIVTKYGVAECQNCGLEESKISKQLTDLEIAIKLEEIEREEPKQTDENGKPITYWGGLEEPKQDYSGVHLRHCYQGEYEDGCKYGEDDCPAKPLEPKQETLEEAAERMYPINSTGGVMEMLNKHQLNNSYKQEGFIAGAKWQQEQEKNNYSEEEVFNLLNNFNKDTLKLRSLKLGNSFNVKDWFSQFKNQEDGND